MPVNNSVAALSAEPASKRPSECDHNETGVTTKIRIFRIRTVTDRLVTQLKLVRYLYADGKTGKKRDSVIDF